MLHGLRALFSRLGLSGAVLALCFAALAQCNLWLVRPWVVPVSNDEGYIAAMALRMIRGHWLPYVDGVSQRGPLLYWLSALFIRAGGIWTWMPMRVLGALLAFAQVALTYALARTIAGRLAAALSATIVTYLLCFELIPWDGLGVNGEPLGSVFALAATLALARAQLGDGTDRRRRALLVASGALSACAALSKQMFLAHALPLAAWAWLGPPSGAVERDARVRRAETLRFALGFLGPFALVLSVYALSSNLGRFVYYFQRYGREIFMDPVNMTSIREAFRPQIERSLTLVLLVLLAWAALVAKGVDRSRPLADRARVVPLVLCAHALLGFAGALFTTRFFGHYFVQVIPWIALVIAVLFARTDEGRSARHWLVVAAALVALGVGVFARGRQIHRWRESDRWFQDPSDDPISRYVRENSRPDQTVFVWGFRAETYLSAERWPASRYVYTVYPAGVVPWFSATRQEMERRVVPGSREELLQDLERERPELLVDAGRTMLDQYMYNYPVFRRFIDQHYCFVRYVDGEPIYRRRREGERCRGALE
ncbi:MAG: hypothetical protein U0269_15680 [Polyangiales bacterium]